MHHYPSVSGTRTASERYTLDMSERLASPKPKADNIDPKNVLWTIFILVIHRVRKPRLLLENDNTATRCANIILKYRRISKHMSGKDDQPASCARECGNITDKRYIYQTYSVIDLCERISPKI